MTELNVKYLTKKELAEYLKVSTNTVDRWRKDDGLPAIKLAKKVLFDVGKVQIWLDARST